MRGKSRIILPKQLLHSSRFGSRFGKFL